MAMESLMVGGPIVLGLAIAATTALKWPSWLHYVWAAIAILFGIVVYTII